MSDTPHNVEGDLHALAVDPPAESAGPAPDAQSRRQVHDMWVAGTEEQAWIAEATDEGAQELLPRDIDPALAVQRGVVVSDDYDVAEQAVEDERQIINMGPQHPSTHGVLRLQLELESETIRRVKPIIGYLHTGMEKTAETLTYTQGATNVTRMDYLSPFHNELCFSLAVEQLLGIEIPARAQAIRVLMTELNRVSSHLLWVATQGMDMGAVSMMLYGWRERELVLQFFEAVTGLRMNHNYVRPGGVAADLPDGWEDQVESLLDVVPKGLGEYEELLSENPIFLDRTQLVSASFCPRNAGPTASPVRSLGRRGSIGISARLSPTAGSITTTSTSPSSRTATCTTGTWCEWRRRSSRSGSCARFSRRCRPATTARSIERSPRPLASESTSRWKP